MDEYAPTSSGERDTPTPTGREHSDQIVHREQDRAALFCALHGAMRSPRGGSASSRRCGERVAVLCESIRSDLGDTGVVVPPRRMLVTWHRVAVAGSLRDMSFDSL